MKSLKMWSALSIALLVLAIILSQPACRREEEPLDKNRPPETFLTLAPPETLEANYKVHLYWHGEDEDGVVENFIFHISDTVNTLKPYEDRELEILDWNPAERKDDYQVGLFTQKTDTVVLFKGYDNETENLRNKQAFHIAAVDDGGLIDPTPARIQFFATAEGRPIAKYWVKKGDGDFVPYDPSVLDTVSLFTPLYFQFRGENANSGIRDYRWSYGEKEYPDSNRWYIPSGDLKKTVGPLNHVRDSLLASGDFYFRGIVRDMAGVISQADYQTGAGLCHIVINFDPNTEITKGDNYYKNEFGDLDSTDVTAYFDSDLNEYVFSPDTLPYGSWLRISYRGWDNPNDILEFTNPEKHMRYKYMLKYEGVSRDGNIASTKTPFFPLIGNAEYNNPGEIDSTTMTVGSYRYTFTVRSYDEQYRYDHTPARVSFYGNFQPTVDAMELGILYTFGETKIFIPFPGDTLLLADPMNDSNWNRSVSGDTIFPAEVYRGGAKTGFKYTFAIKATGHDDPRDPADSAIRSWIFWIDGSNRDYNFDGERDAAYPATENELLENVLINIPVDAGTGYPDSTFVAGLPQYMGLQNYSIVGYDMGREEDYIQKIRQQSPQFAVDPETGETIWGTEIKKGELYENESNLANYARKDTLSGSFYIRPLW